MDAHDHALVAFDPEDALGRRWPLPEELAARFPGLRPLPGRAMAGLWVAPHDEHGTVEVHLLRPLVASWDPLGALADLTRLAEAAPAGLLPLLGVGRVEDGVWMALGRGVGETLARRLEVHPGGLPAGEVVRVLEDLEGALAGLHDLGLVHGLPEPVRVWLTQDGAARLEPPWPGLWLSARDRLAALVVGRCDARVAPEVLAGEAPGAGGDHYVWATTAVEALCGRPWIEPWQVWRAARRGEWPEAPELPADLPGGLRQRIRGRLHPEAARRSGEAAGADASGGERSLGEDLRERLARVESRELPGLPGHRAAGVSSGVRLCLLLVAGFLLLGLGISWLVAMPVP